MLVVFKAAFLFLSIIFVLPVIFLLLVGGVGKYFSLTIDKNSWIATTKISWIRGIVKKFTI